MFVPGGKRSYDSGDTSPIEVDDGMVTFTREFKYLGGLVSSTGGHKPEIAARLEKAAAVFGSLRSCIFASRDVSARVKKKVYLSMVVTVLLYGSECWALTVNDEERLNLFHRRCVRTMAGLSRWQQQKKHVHDGELAEKLELETMKFYLRRRTLKWVGHVVRMDYDRLPRKLLFGWVNNGRPRGRPPTSLGQRIERLVDDALEVTEPIIRRKVNGKRGVGWVEFAQDRVGWRQLVNAGRKFGNEVARGAKAAGGRRNPEEARGGGQNFSF